MNKKRLLVVVSLVLILAVAAGGTVAWLTDRTETVKNTFTIGDIDIRLTEAGADPNQDKTRLEQSFKMVPGVAMSKEPKVIVEKGSEPCWVFVKVEESSVLSDYIEYAVDADKDLATDNWTPLDGVTGVYYYKQETPVTADGGLTLSILAVNTNTGEEVLVKPTVTEKMMEALNVTDATQPTLTFTAYAVQLYGSDTAAAAWAKLNG